MSTHRSTLTALLLGASLLLSSAPVMATPPPAEGDDGSGFIISMSSLYGVAFTSVILTISAPFLTTSGVGGSALTTLKKQAINDHLDHNRAALEAAITLGGGDALDDLAALCGVAPAQRHRTRRGFARRVRQHRATLLPLLRATGQDRAQQIFTLLHTLHAPG